VLLERPDAVVVATGALPRGPSFPVTDETLVVEDTAVLLGLTTVGRRIVVIDQTGLARSASVAEFLVDRGHDVTIVTHDAFAASQLVLTQDLTLWYQRALSKGIKFLTEVQVLRVTARTVVLSNRYTMEQKTLEDVDTVVLSNYPVPDQRLFLLLTQRGLTVFRVGDCVAPRDIGSAVREGNLVARGL
jgi:2,4-dienoyl-CoA reductase (NADPH2)